MNIAYTYYVAKYPKSNHYINESSLLPHVQSVHSPTNECRHSAGHIRLGCYVSTNIRPVVMHAFKEEMHTVHTTVISETLQIDIFRFILQPAAH